jgi:hypothetical protein
VAPIVLTQPKEHKRIGEVRTPIRHALPVVIELASIIGQIFGYGLMFCSLHHLL